MGFLSRLFRRPIECREFGTRAAATMLHGVTATAPRLAAATGQAISVKEASSALAILSKFTFEMVVELRRLPPEYGIALVGAASEVFDPTIAEGLGDEPQEVPFTYIRIADSIREALRRIPAGGADAFVVACCVLSAVSRSVDMKRPPTEAVTIIDEFFRAMTSTTMKSMNGATFAKPPSATEALLRR